MAKQIVIIEDDESILQLFDNVLSDQGYAVTLCRSGSAAVQCLRDVRPDAAILDVRLETWETGWEVLCRIKSDDVLEAIPVIVCSADHRSLQAHADTLARTGSSSLLKPFGVDDLLDKVQKVVYPEGCAMVQQGV